MFILKNIIANLADLFTIYKPLRPFSENMLSENEGFSVQPALASGS
jgi:hypothetical protein